MRKQTSLKEKKSMELFSNLGRICSIFLEEGMSKIGLGEKLETFNDWRKKGQNNKLTFAILLFLAALFITFMYLYSQQPDV